MFIIPLLWNRWRVRALLAGIGTLLMVACIALVLTWAADGLMKGGARYTMTAGKRKNRVAFVCDGNIWVMNVDGTGRRQLTRDGKVVLVRWSPDGKRLLFLKIAFVGKDGYGCDLWVMGADGKNARKLFGSQDRFAHFVQVWQGWGKNGNPKWSPDGKWIAFSSTNVNSLNQWHHDSACLSDLWVVRTDGTRIMQLVRGEITYRGTETCFVWLPDSRQLIYWNAIRDSIRLSQDGSCFGYFTLISLGGRERRLTFARIPETPSAGLHEPCVAWTAESKQILIGLNSIWGRSGFETTKLYRVTTSGHATKQPIKADWFCAFSHKSDRIVSDIDEGNQLTLWVSRLDGSKRRRLVLISEEDMEPQVLWSPDDRLIAYFLPFRDLVSVCRPDGRVKGWRIFKSPEKGEVQRINWTADNLCVVIQMNTGKWRTEPQITSGNIYVAEVDKAEVRQLTKDGKCIDFDVER